MNANIYKGEIFRHFKNHIAIVDNIARHSETDEMMVVYHHLNEDDDTVWVRPINMWFDDKVNAYGEIVKRFTRLYPISCIYANELHDFDIDSNVSVVRKSDNKIGQVMQVLTDGDKNYIKFYISNNLFVLEEGEMFKTTDDSGTPEFDKFTISII